MADATNKSDSEYTKIGFPAIYDGNVETARGWLNSVRAYLTPNKNKYDTSEKKIIFALSFMKEGTALGWAEGIYEAAFAKKKNDKGEETDEEVGFGKWDEFIEDFKTAFSYMDTPTIAIGKISVIQQGTDTVDEYIAKFRTLAFQTGITDTGPLIIWFTAGLKAPLVRQIYSNFPLPTTMEEWYSRASLLENQWRRGQATIEGQGRTGGGKKKDNFRRNNRPGPGGGGPSHKPQYRPRDNHARTQTHDPDAMDTSIRHILTREEKDRFFKEGRCFHCQETGHRAAQCPNKKPQQYVRKVETRPQKEDPDRIQTIRNIWTQSTKEEKDAIYEELGEEEWISKKDF